MAQSSNVQCYQNIRLSQRYEHTISWTTEAAQHAYFEAKAIQTLTGMYQEKDGTIRVDAPREHLQSVNYVGYRNTAQGNKWFYGFVTGMRHVSEGMTEISFETDVIQTWYFETQFLPCFVEREHVVDDTPYLHTYPEGIEHGEYVGEAFSDNGLSPTITVVYSTVDLMDNDFPPNGGSMVNGTMMAGVYYGFSTITMFKSRMVEINGAGKGDAILSVFKFPRSLCGNPGDGVPLDGLMYSYNVNRSKGTSHGTYTPKNNKLLCYPYMFLGVSNNNGAAVDLHYEDFPGQCIFAISGNVGEAVKVRCTPSAYTKNTNDYSLSLPSFPQSSYQSDVFAAWFAQCGATLAVNQGTRLLSTAVGAGNSISNSVVSGNIAGAVTSGVDTVISVASQIASLEAMIYEKQLLPPSASSNAGASNGIYEFTFIAHHMRPEIAEIADDYLEVNGYKRCIVKTPGRRNRPSWSIIKTVGCVVAGAIQGGDREKIEAIHDKGITYWTNGDQIGNYGLNNH